MNNLIHLAEHWAQEIAADCAQAQRSITISAISLQPPRQITEMPWPQLWKSWILAAQRGVMVSIFLPSVSRAHPATAYNAAAALTAFNAGMRVRFVPQPHLLHAKTVILDENIVWIGSGNMTAAAAHHNHELYCRFQNHEIAARIAENFDNIANPP